MLRSRSAHVSSRYRLRRGETRRRDRFVCWRNNRRHRRTHKMEPRYVLPSYIFRHTISPRAAGQCGESSLKAIAAVPSPRAAVPQPRDEQRDELAALHLSHAMARPVRFVCRIFRVSWSGRRIRGADLKCSESGTWAAAASCRAQQAPGPKVALRRKLLFLDKRTLAFAQGLGRLFSRNAPENLVIVPFCLGFARRLNFDEIHVVRHAAVPAHSPFGEEIVDRQLPYLICDRLSIYRPRCLHRPEIVQHR